jgi:hypothetical protein
MLPRAILRLVARRVADCTTLPCFWQSGIVGVAFRDAQLAVRHELVDAL